MSDHVDRAALIVDAAIPNEVSGMRHRYAQAAVRALDKAGLLATEHDAEVAARAWDEGYTRGFYTGTSGQYGPASDASEPDAPNPYERTEPAP